MPFGFPQEIQERPASLVVVPEPVRFVDQYRAGIAEQLPQAPVVRQVGFGQSAAAQNFGVGEAELVAGPFPHSPQAGRADYQGVSCLSFLDGQPPKDFGTNEGLSHADDIGDVAAVVVFQHRHASGNRVQLVFC